MIATAKPSPESLSIPAWHAGFLEMLPAIRRQARLAFRHLDPEAREEAVEEAVANGNGCRDDQDEGGRNGQPATARQLDYATRLAGQIRGLGSRRLAALAQQLFAKPLAELGSAEASGLIDTLKRIKAGQVDLQAALRGVVS